MKIGIKGVMAVIEIERHTQKKAERLIKNKEFVSLG